MKIGLLSTVAATLMLAATFDVNVAYAQGRGHGGGGHGFSGHRMGGFRMGPGPGIGRSHFAGPRHFGGRGFGGYGHDFRRYGGYGGFGVGLATGALLGSSYGWGGYYPGYAGNYYPDDFDVEPYGGDVVVTTVIPERDVAYCIRTFRSYNQRTGTYRGYDGNTYSCP